MKRKLNSDMEKWVVYNKRADFAGIGKTFGIDQVTARIIRNRDVRETDEIRSFLQGTMEDLYDPHLLKDADLLVSILLRKLQEKKSIRVIGDYDIDGVMSTYILVKALRMCKAEVTWQIPDRIIDGYGLNENLIRKAQADGIDTILTCDNGIAALKEIELAKSLGMTVLVTDHHEIPFEVVTDPLTGQERKKEKVSMADAVVNVHQQACTYPNKDMCGASTAWKVICLLFEKLGFPKQSAYDFIENVAFATVGDIMSLKGENRIFVKEGLKAIRHTKNIGMKALILQCGLDFDRINVYHFGFVLGPCINATGRLDTANRALALFLSEDPAEAAMIANELVVLNEERKKMTSDGVELAKKAYVDQNLEKDRVLIIYLPEVHESIAGIIAGRIRECYYKPTIILTRAKDGLKGSGRSIETYSMYEELCKCQDLLTKFGGHPMAAGLSLKEENLEEFRRRMNAECTLTPDQLLPKIYIDVPMPVSYVTMDLVREFNLLEPFGKDNPKPLFAEKNISIERMWIIGKNRNVLRLSLRSSDGIPVPGIYFGDIPKFQEFLTQKFGSSQVEAAMSGRPNTIRISMVYSPQINSFRDTESLQFEIKYYC